MDTVNHGLPARGPRGSRILVSLIIASSLWFSPLLLAATGDWRGFRGLEKQGYDDSGNPPVHWAPSSNLLWKTAIPGHGHSSPIVSGDAVYVTAAYVTPRHSHVRAALHVASLCLASLAVVSFVWLRVIRSTHPLPVRALLLLIAVAIAGTALVYVARRWSVLEVNDARAWKVSILAALFCILVAAAGFRISSLFAPLAALALFGLSFVSYSFFPERKSALWNLQSASDILNPMTVVLPALVGFALLCSHFAISRSPRAPVRDAYLTVRISTATAAFMLAAIIIIDANYLRRTREMVRAVICLSAADGRIRWACEGLPSVQGPLPQMNSPATPTPATDGERIFAYFGSAGLMCVSRQGKLLWQNRNFSSETRFGTASSLALFNDLVLVVNDSEEPWARGIRTESYLAAVNALDGRERWRISRPATETYSGYASPIIDASLGRALVWVRGWADLRAYDPKDGSTVLAYPSRAKGPHLASSPVIAGGNVYLVDSAQVSALALSRFTENIGPQVWSRRSRGDTAATPVVAGGLLFTVSESGLAICLDAATGVPQWEEKLRGRYFASPLATRAHVYFTSESGLITVVSADRKFNRVAENSLGARIFASPAPSGDRLFVRTVDSLICIAPRRLNPQLKSSSFLSAIQH